MAFKLPSLEKSKPNPLPSVLGDNFPLFSWNELFEKEDPIGRGSFGSVFVAKRGNQKGEKVVVKKLLNEENYEQRLFLKEASILQKIKHDHVVQLIAACVKPCAIMLEYVYFDFEPSVYSN